MSENYFILNKETGKLELHFEKSTYAALTDAQKSEIKSNFLWGRRSGCWISRAKEPNLYYARKGAESIGLEDAGTEGERLSFAEQQARKQERAERPRGKRLVPIYAGHTGGAAGHFIVDPLHYDLARCLDFFAYQCREDATYNTDLYKGMNDLSIVVARFIVRNSDGYTKSRWGEV